VRGIVRERGVEVVVGFGGYASAPAYAAARKERLPIAVHEQNARPGIANRLAARWSRHVGVTFPGTRLRRSRVVGLPLRAEIERLDRPSARLAGLKLFGLDADTPVLLVTGGSTGALRLNRSVVESVAAILGAGWQVLHITGSRSPVDDPGLAGYRILEYCDRMDLALAVADVAVSRAGAATVCELAAVGIPAVFVPYPVGNGEQALNARGAVDAGGAVLVIDAAFTPDYVERELPVLLADRARVADMTARMASVGVRDGADRMVDLIIEAQGVEARTSGRR
jgi:UDP-N-acetylglucosamine--N-acetylmuramyl-(pentapeptide) pyrophosphoryl-undecaprenol N-acetylglucosamine transferase